MEYAVLVLRRRQGERIAIGGDIEIEVVEISRTRVKLAVTAPRNVSVVRGETIGSQEQLRARIKYLTVDEYQDVNPIQEMLIRQLHDLGANLCVLLEKPVASSAMAAAGLLAATQSGRGFVLPGHILRFSRDHRRLVEIVRAGHIGEVIYVGSRRYRDDAGQLDPGHVLSAQLHPPDNQKRRSN